jgi:hypothetical protein
MLAPATYLVVRGSAFYLSGSYLYAAPMPRIGDEPLWSDSALVDTFNTIERGFFDRVIQSLKEVSR